MHAAQKRNVTKEQYFTRDDVSESLIQLLKNKSPNIFRKIRLFVEPSVGDGSFMRALNKYTKKKKIGLDIDPKIRGANIHRQDFLKFDYDKHIEENPSNVMCVGNPPFGHQSTLAKKFINHCAKFFIFL